MPARARTRTRDVHPPRRNRTGSLVAGLFASAALGAGCADQAETARETEHAVIGECTRDEAVLRGELIECSADVQCPCGSFCDTADHVCRFECMVPPADPSESCTTGTQCDDTGRCVAPGGPASLAAVLSSNPTAIRTVAGGASSTLQVRLTAFFAAALPAAQATEVRAIGQDGAEVSCNASVFAHECTLTGWTFAFDGAKFNAAKTLWVRTVAGTPGGSGQVELRVEAASTQIVVPAGAGDGGPTEKGRFGGKAISDGMPGGVDVTAVSHNRFLVVRDPSRIVAPDGTLVLDLAFDGSSPISSRSLVWLTAPGATDDDQAIHGQYHADPATFDPATGALQVPLTIVLPSHKENWTLELSRQGDEEDECQKDTDCGDDELCPDELNQCIPSAAWNTTPGPVVNKLDDLRSLAWWNALDDQLGLGDVPTGLAKPAFATTGADLIETLLCTLSETDADAGRLGVAQLKFGAAAPSRSGDLGCVQGTPPGQILTPGAVGLVTRADRKGDAVSLSLLQTCLQDLARPVTDIFSINFNINTGDCVNLARFVPALRLLATGELGKRTKADRDGRGRGLFTRLVQQWSSLQGFLASTGLSDREYDDAIAATPSEGRSELLTLLDALDAGWAALLDQRIAPMFPAASAWAPTTPTDAARDYRLLKRPLVYWTFNGAGGNFDIVNNVPLGIPSRPCDLTGLCPIPDWCKILPSRNSILLAWNCRGFQAFLPAAPAPSVAGDDNISVVFNVDPLDEEFPPYGGGTILAMQKLAVIVTYATGVETLLVLHPTGPGTREAISFTEMGGLGHWTGGTTGGDGPPAGSSVALVRDAASKTYTLYTWKTGWAPDLHAITRPYAQPVSGVLDSIAPNKLLVGAGPQYPTPASWWPQYNRSYGAKIDDVAIYDSVLSKRDFLRFAVARGYAEERRDLYPIPAMSLIDHGTQEMTVPVGAALLEAEASTLDVVARLADHMKYEAQTACEVDDLTGDAARADIDEIVARIGRSLRQSAVIEHFASMDTSERADAARQLLRAKRSQIGRRLRALVSCVNPYGMGDDEVPLYFGSIAPNVDEKAAFFAASDHLLLLAEQRANGAQAALTDVQTRWNNARLSQLQELQDDTSRAIRVDEMKGKYGDGLRRLCGISDQTAEQVMADVSAGTFDVNTCFVIPTASCLTESATGQIMESNPACYRGVIGGALMDMRTAHHGQQGAYQSWQAAMGNAESAERLCVIKEMNAFGCSALDEHELEGVTCPPDHQGTLELIDQFNDYMDDKEAEKGWFDAVISTVSTIVTVSAAYATTGPGGAFMTVALANMSLLDGEMTRSMEARKRRHEQVLAARAAEDAILTCWNQAEQFERAVGAAEESSLQASDHLQSATIAFQNSLAEANEILLEGPVVIDRELTRPSIPIAFHYWLPEAIIDYRVALESARRYAYVALRAVEHDALDSYVTPHAGKPLRSAVLGAWRPNVIQQQLQLMRDQTNTRTTRYGQPHLGHITFDLGQKVFGIGESSPDFGATLLSYSRPVYSTRGEYLGLGVRFSMVPQADDEAPTWRCAERIWRVNVGTAGYPSGGGDNFHLKLLKRNAFASRKCRDEGFESATLRPGSNLLVAAGEPQTYVPEATNTVADISVVRLDTGNALDDFRNRDDAYNASSTELSLQGLYGDYVLLFPSIALGSGLDLTGLFDFNLRFDFVSIDDTPPTLRAARPSERRRAAADPGPRLQVEASQAPIVVE